MKTFNIFENGAIAEILHETTAPGGVARIAQTLADDLFLATGRKTLIHNNPDDCVGDRVIFVATIGHSARVDALVAANAIDISCIDGKRECYMMKVLDIAFTDGVKEVLLIIGSDKRGTIYGMFRLSELCGISPLVFWGDAVPAQEGNLWLDFEDDIISKEPSVKYRGFFINDEWPAFGKWCKEHYGDVNAKAYDKIFQLVLRLKGNYMWPAMWDSSFSEDGPGLENAKLADEYGVIMGASHHEPMNRAGVEWQRQYSNYGDDNTWSFVANSKAITEFWKDGIVRNKDFENIITIGMRGENDSLLMGENATIQDNINVLKDAITTQNKLIKKHINSNLKSVPRMFAIYKEVEDFYFGADGLDGLKGWSELKDVILLFSDDNHGNLRAIPSLTDKKHSGGYGIYYHFDYHGGPYSFEWLNHTNLVHAWEQLTMAYEYGIRDMWIVNVGDIKGNEYPLSFFMDLAYDYEKWGITNLNSASEYTEQWINTQFGNTLSAKHKEQIRYILGQYTLWSSVRIPESMNPDVFKNNFCELERVHEAAEKILVETDTLRNSLPGRHLPAFESMIYYPVMAFFSAFLVNLTAGLNYTHASRGSVIANQYASQLANVIPKDRFYVNKFHNFKNGKWNHMMESAHMCFKTWDDNDWTYPVTKLVSPIPYPKIVVSFRGFDTYNIGHHWQDTTYICNTELTRPDVNEIIIDIDSRGDVDFNYSISCDKPWLTFSQTFGKSLLKETPRTSVTARCDRSILSGDDTALVKIDFIFKDEVKKQAFVNVRASNFDNEKYSGAFLEAQDYICIHAENYSSKTDVSGNGWVVVPRLGRTGNAIKSFPVTKNWTDADKRPYVSYSFVITQTRDYIITFYLSPRNSMVKGAAIKGCFSINKNAAKLFDVTSPDMVTFDSDEDWSYGATNNIRKVSFSVSLKKGLNKLNFYATDPNVILEDIVIHPKDIPVPETHLAPPESYRIP